MNHRTFTRLLSEGPVEVEIIKKSQIYGHFLTNRSDHHNASYPVINDTTLHLNPGDRLDVISAIAAQGVYRHSCIKVRRERQEFHIILTDYKRFIKIV